MPCTRRVPQPLWLVLLAMAISGTACQINRDRTAKVSSDWSRGLLLGETRIKQPVALQVDAQGHVHLIWCGTSSDDGDELYYVHLDNRGHVLDSESGRLNLNLPNPRKPQLLLDAEDQLHLAWLSRAEGLQRLYHVQMDAKDRMTRPLLVSGDEEDVDSFHMFLSSDGEITLVWSGGPGRGGTQAGISLRRLRSAAPFLLVPSGIDPHVLVDSAGTTHLVWLYERGRLRPEMSTMLRCKGCDSSLKAGRS
jgi:hypothetical protein